MVPRGFVVAGALGLGLLRVADASACSCMGPHDEIIGGPAEGAPLNARVRVEVALRMAGRANKVIVRAHDGANVETTTRTWPDGGLMFAELTPKSTLAPKTRYEIAIVDPAEFPSTTVLGTFTTGTASDTTPPKLDAIGSAVAKGSTHPSGGSCGIAGPWVEVGPLKASDPDHPKAKLLYAVWGEDAKGVVDATRPPDTLLEGSQDASQNVVTIGKSSLCDPHDFRLPTTPSGSFAIAAVDEAGNMSATRKFKVSFGAHP